MAPAKKKKRNALWVLRTFRAMVKRRLICRNTTVIAITGSCAKTSTTWFLGKIISDHASCFVGIDANVESASIRNLLKLKRRCRFYIQEAGASFIGSMRRQALLLRQDIAVVTTVGRDHYSEFRGVDAVAEEKGFLVESLPASGVAVLNADDPYVLAMAERTSARVLTYGCSEHAAVRGSDVRSDWPDLLSLTVTYQGETVRIETGLFGSLLVSAVLAAIASALAAGFDLKQCAQSLSLIESYHCRMSLHQSRSGIWFVHDAFKASFWSVAKVVDLLEHVTAPRKTLVFGSFSDISGSDSSKYRSTAKAALKVADRVVFVGGKAQYIRKMMSAETDGRLFVFDAPEDASAFLEDHALKDELVLIKSNGLDHLERLIHGHMRQLKCWKVVCPKQIQCSQCEESGLLAPQVSASSTPFPPSADRPLGRKKSKVKKSKVKGR